jgi:pimeloyl-ACP methyl ester carboxylesterase
MQTIRIEAAAGAPAQACIVLLPGALQVLEDFRRAGFDAALQQRRLPLELLLVAPAPAHLTDRSWIEALKQEIIEPLRQTRRPLWLGGISLGAFRALRYAAEFPQGVDGLCLLAPYLGSRIVAAEIAACRSFKDWQPGALAAEDDERRIWAYVRDLRTPPPEVFLGLSRGDRFADTQQLLARALPASSRFEIEGRHEWPVWRQLWDIFLDRQGQREHVVSAVPSAAR